MKIECAEFDRRKYKELKRQRQAIVDEYNTRKDAYEEQANAYRADYGSFADAIVAEIRNAFAEELKPFPGIDIYVEDAFVDNQLVGFAGRGGYNIHLNYASDRNDNMHGRNRTGYRYRSAYGLNGISWEFNLRLESDGNVYKNPKIIVDELDSADYSTLAAMYTLFQKIEVFDWAEMFNRIIANAPKADKMITNPAPGNAPETAELDKELAKFQVLDYIGKDVWIKAMYKANVNSYGDRLWVKFLSLNSTGKKCRVKSIHTYGDSWDNPLEGSRSFWIRTEELRVGGFSFPQPLTMLTGEEMAPVLNRSY